MARLRAQGAGGFVDQFEGLANTGGVAASAVGERQPAGQAFEQLEPEARFQAADLLGHRRLGHSQFLGAEAKAGVARNHFEYAQGVEGGRDEWRHGSGIGKQGPFEATRNRPQRTASAVENLSVGTVH